jgi:hypothetical protein
VVYQPHAVAGKMKKPAKEEKSMGLAKPLCITGISK